MIRLRDIHKSYQMGDNLVQALKGVNLDIDDGDFVAIMGPSGSGKSTLMHVLGLLDIPNSGSYQLHGREVANLSEDDLAVLRREEIGFIFQQFNLLPRMTALENVSLPQLYSERNFTLDRAQSLLETVGLGPRSFHKPNELSGGQQQRVAIARSLINKPRTILADEPTGNLDSQSEKEIMATLKRLNAEGITVIIVTHEEEIGMQAKRLIRMRDGVVQSDERREPLPQTKIAVEVRHTRPSEFNWREILEHFKQGAKTLAANKIRTALSMLGILIGVGAVVAMLALGRGAQQAIEQQLSSLGSNLLVLRTGSIRTGGVAQGVGNTTRITVEDVGAIVSQIPDVKAVSPQVNSTGQVVFQDKNWNTRIMGVGADYQTIRNAKPEHGRFFLEEENKARARVAVIGMTLVRELFGTKNPIGEMIKINKVNFQVIGILPEKGANGFQDQDDVVVVPISTAMHRLMGKIYVDSVDIEGKDASSADQVQDDIVQLLVGRHRLPPSQQQEAFQVRNMADIQAALTESSRTMSLLLASIAAISLLVGGIGIMNIMLVSVTERTKEIGLRKAIGARRRDILLQFLVEAVVVSAVGGVAGVILGWSSTLILSAALGWTTSVSINSVAMSFGFSALIGILFGIYPARKAAALPPIEALRFE
jgi:macrolide transport system ATP-binding/permease protein